jgi:phage protein D
VVLNNEGGAYTLYGAGDLAVLQRGARLQLSPGYKGAGGAEVADEKGAYWITEIEQVTGE